MGEELVECCEPTCSRERSDIESGGLDDKLLAQDQSFDYFCAAIGYARTGGARIGTRILHTLRRECSRRRTETMQGWSLLKALGGRRSKQVAT